MQTEGTAQHRAHGTNRTYSLPKPKLVCSIYCGMEMKNNTNLSIQNEMLRRRGTVRPYGEETKWTARERRWSYRRISSIVVRVAHQPQYLYHPLGDGGKFCVQSKHRHQRFIRVSKQANSDTDLSKLLQCYIDSCFASWFGLQLCIHDWNIHMLLMHAG